MKGKGDKWVSSVNESRPIPIGERGIAADQPLTIIENFKITIGKFSNNKAISVKRDGVWKDWTWKAYYDDVMQFAKALIHIGLQPLQCVSILGFNSPEWFIGDLGAIAAGGIAAGIYTTNGPDACKYIIEHSESIVVLVENEAQLKKILQVREQLPLVRAIVQWSGQVPEVDNVYGWQDFLNLGNNVSAEVLEQRLKAQQPEHCATLIYTSGTTGPPKAVMLSHDNLSWTAKALAESIGACNEQDSVISYLPLSHVAAQVSDIHAPMIVGATIYFAQPDALKGSLGTTLKEVRPTLFLGVPRVWEKIFEKMKEVGAQSGTLKKRVAGWARYVGLVGGYAQQRGQPVPWGWWLASKVVFEPVRAALGLDRARLCASSAAPISRETLDFFLSLNIGLVEAYGMSECTGPETGTFYPNLRTGSAGKPIAGTELKIDRPDAQGNGEICWRGRNVFLGYLKNEQATSETIDSDGFLHSGDIGRLDEDGFLYITGRIKELIITAGGENIPPVAIEDELKKELGHVISNVMVIGDRRKFLSCVFTIKAAPVADHVEGQYPFLDTIHPDARRVLEADGITATTIAEAQQDPKLKQWLEKGVTAVNKRATSNAQQVRKFLIAPDDFALENDALTPTLKLKRRVVLQRYGDAIDKMYEDAEREMAGQ